MFQWCNNKKRVLISKIQILYNEHVMQVIDRPSFKLLVFKKT